MSCSTAPIGASRGASVAVPVATVPAGGSVPCSVGGVVASVAVMSGADVVSAVGGGVVDGAGVEGVVVAITSDMEGSTLGAVGVSGGGGVSVCWTADESEGSTPWVVAEGGGGAGGGGGVGASGALEISVILASSAARSAASAACGFSRIAALTAIICTVSRR